jgi:hypothetical protein
MYFPKPFKKLYFSILDWPKERYGWRSLKVERRFHREAGLESWKEFKMSEVSKTTGILKLIPDEQFIQFRKSFGFTVNH